MKRFKCLVEKCGHVTKTKSGITSHVRNHHNEAMVKGTTYITTRDPVSNPNRNGPKKAKRPGPPNPLPIAQKPVVTAETQYIDVPCVLRVCLGGFEVKGAFLRKG